MQFSIYRIAAVWWNSCEFSPNSEIKKPGRSRFSLPAIVTYTRIFRIQNNGLVFYRYKWYRKSRYWHLVEVKSDFPRLRAVKGKNTAQWASKWQNKTAGGGRGENCTGLGVNNGDVTAGRRMTERQDNGLLSPFSVLASPPLALPLFLLGRGFLFLFYRTISLTAAKQKAPGGRPPGGIFEDRRIARFICWQTRGHGPKKGLQSNGRTVKACRVSSGYRVHRPDDVCLFNVRYYLAFLSSTFRHPHFAIHYNSQANGGKRLQF